MNAFVGKSHYLTSILLLLAVFYATAQNTTTTDPNIYEVLINSQDDRTSLFKKINTIKDKYGIQTKFKDYDLGRQGLTALELEFTTAAGSSQTLKSNNPNGIEPHLLQIDATTKSITYLGLQNKATMQDPVVATKSSAIEKTAGTYSIKSDKVTDPSMLATSQVDKNGPKEILNAKKEAENAAKEAAKLKAEQELASKKQAQLKTEQLKKEAEMAAKKQAALDAEKQLQKEQMLAAQKREELKKEEEAALAKASQLKMEEEKKEAELAAIASQKEEQAAQIKKEAENAAKEAARLKAEQELASKKQAQLKTEQLKKEAEMAAKKQAALDAEKQLQKEQMLAAQKKEELKKEEAALVKASQLKMEEEKKEAELAAIASQKEMEAKRILVQKEEQAAQKVADLKEEAVQEVSKAEQVLSQENDLTVKKVENEISKNIAVDTSLKEKAKLAATDDDKASMTQTIAELKRLQEKELKRVKKSDAKDQGYVFINAQQYIYEVYKSRTLVYDAMERTVLVIPAELDERPVRGTTTINGLRYEFNFKNNILTLSNGAGELVDLQGKVL